MTVVKTEKTQRTNPDAWAVNGGFMPYRTGVWIDGEFWGWAYWDSLDAIQANYKREIPIDWQRTEWEIPVDKPVVI